MNYTSGVFTCKDNCASNVILFFKIRPFHFLAFYLFQVAADLYKIHVETFSAANMTVLLEVFSLVSSHAHELNSETILQKKLEKVCSILELTAPPIVHFENESYKNFLNFLQNSLVDNPSLSKKMNIEAKLVAVCEDILQIYLKCTELQSSEQKPVLHWILPLGTAKKEELATRTFLAVSASQALSGLEKASFRRHVSQLFPLLVDLVKSEHTSGEVQHVLSNIFQSCIGPIIME